MEKKHFFDKLFLSLNILNFRLFFYVKSATSLKKDTPSFPATPLVYFLCKNCNPPWKKPPPSFPATPLYKLRSYQAPLPPF